jgi:uncharacterized protein
MIKNNQSIPLSFIKLLQYIFIPPFLTMMLYILLTISFHEFLPPLLLFFLSALFVLFPIQLFLILRENKKLYGNYTFKIIFFEQRKQPLWLVILLGMMTFGFAGLMTLIWMPIESSIFSFLSIRLYESIPNYFNWKDLDNLITYSKPVLLVTGILYLILNGFIGPIVEELFFRGFLTKKLAINSLVAPLIISILFSIYHFWLPFDFFFRVIAFFPAFYLAWKLKDIRISIVFHCLSNIFTAIMFLIAILAL